MLKKREVEEVASPVAAGDEDVVGEDWAAEVGTTDAIEVGMTDATAIVMIVMIAA